MRKKVFVMKKLLSILLATVMLFSVLSIAPVTTMAADEAVIVSSEAGFFDGFFDFFSDIINSILDLFTPEQELPDVSEWTDEEIIEYYKKAARKTRYEKPDKNFVLNDHSYSNVMVNGEKVEADDLMDTFPQFIDSMNSARVKSGVMGNYKNLTVDDCKSVKAHTDGDYTVIEIKFRDQYDSSDDSKDKITLSHGMQDFGELSPQSTKIRIMGMIITMPDTTADYSNAIAKVKINSRGKVEYGTWSYDVHCVAKNNTGEVPRLSFTIGFDMMMDLSCTMTLGGGF